MNRIELGSFPDSHEKNLGGKIYSETAEILKEKGEVKIFAFSEFISGKVGRSLGLVVDARRIENGERFKIFLNAELPDDPSDDPKELVKEHKSNLFISIRRRNKNDSFPDRILKMETNGDVSICKGRGTGFKKIENRELQRYLDLVRELKDFNNYKNFSFNTSAIPFYISPS